MFGAPDTWRKLNNAVCRPASRLIRWCWTTTMRSGMTRLKRSMRLWSWRAWNSLCGLGRTCRVCVLTFRLSGWCFSHVSDASTAFSAHLLIRLQASWMRQCHHWSPGGWLAISFDVLLHCWSLCSFPLVPDSHTKVHIYTVGCASIGAGYAALCDSLHAMKFAGRFLQC